MKLLRFLLASALIGIAGTANGAGAFGNSVGVDYCADETSSTFPSECAKPSADVDGTIIDIVQAFNDQTAGAFQFLINGSGQTITVITSPTNAPTLYQVGSQWRLGLTADSTPFQGNHASGVGAQKTMVAMVYTGINTTTPIRASAISTGTSNTPVCPTTASAQVGDIVSRRMTYHGDGNQQAVTRPGGHTQGPLHQPAASNGKDIAIDFYIAASAAAPGTATYGIASSQPWTCETVVFASAAGASGGLLLRRRRS
jgi:hypothetical protein